MSRKLCALWAHEHFGRADLPDQRLKKDWSTWPAQWPNMSASRFPSRSARGMLSKVLIVF